MCLNNDSLKTMATDDDLHAHSRRTKIIQSQLTWHGVI